MFDNAVRDWKPLETTIPLEDDHKFVGPGQMLASADVLPGIRVDSSNALAAYTVQLNGKAILRLADGRNQKVMDLGEIKSAPSKSRIGMHAINGLTGVLITCGDKAFIYKSSAGVAVPVNIEAASPQDLLFLDNEGNQIFQDRASGQVIRKPINQPERILWPK